MLFDASQRVSAVKYTIAPVSSSLLIGGVIIFFSV